MIDKEKYLWKRGTITIDDDGFHVPNDEKGVITIFLDSVLSDDLEGKVDEVFTRHADIFSDDDNDTFGCGDDVFAYPLTEIIDLDDFRGVLENTPEDWEFIKQEEIWAIHICGNIVDPTSGVQAIRGEDLRYLVHEARKVWAEWTKLKVQIAVDKDPNKPSKFGIIKSWWITEDNNLNPDLQP